MARDLLRQMDEAAELDRQANSSGQPALEKLKLLSEVQKWIKKFLLFIFFLYYFYLQFFNAKIKKSF
jgi:hypothetical protein